MAELLLILILSVELLNPVVSLLAIIALRTLRDIVDSVLAELSRLAAVLPAVILLGMVVRALLLRVLFILHAFLGFEGVQV